MSSYKENIRPINTLYKSVEKWIEKDLFYKSFRRICDDFDKNWKKDLHQNHWEKSKIRQLLQIHERLQLTDCLIEDIESSFQRQYEYPKLITYLRLTCFDLLGQPNEWMIFSDWTKSKRKSNERSLIIEKIEFNTELEFAEKIYLEYQSIYGVKNSFFRFLNEILPSKNLDDLLSQIKIQINEEIGRRIIEHQATDLDKENYLFKIRNDYTHKVYGKAPIHGFNSKQSDSDWNFRETIYKNNKIHRIYTSINFEKKLREVILIGIVEIIKKY